MTMSPHVETLDQKINSLKRQVKAQTLVVSDLIRTDIDAQEAEHILWGLMDRLSVLRNQRFKIENLSHTNAYALSIVEHRYSEDHALEVPLTQVSNELVHRLNDLALGEMVFLTKFEFEHIFNGDDADSRSAAIALTEQCGCRIIFRSHSQTRAIITKHQRRSEVNAGFRARA